MKKSEKKETFNSVKLVVFCGNPGKEYSKTRHNIAWMLLDRLDNKSFNWHKKFKGQYAGSDFGNEKIIFLKPETFMNLSGESVLPAAGFFRIKPQEILVCHDDIELDFGTVSVKFSGGTAGHNGLRSIARVLGTPDFYRFRLGISRPVRMHVDSYVLGRFSSIEEAMLPDYMRLAADYLYSALTRQDRESIETGEKTVLLNT